MKSLKHINKYFYKYRWRLGLGILFVAISNLFKVYSVRYFSDAIDYVKRLLENPQLTSSPLKALLLFGATIILLSIISGFFLFLTRQSIIVMSRLIEYDLKNEVYRHYQQLDTRFYKRNNTGDLMNRISEDVSRVRMYIGPAIMYIVNTAITFVLTIYVMLQTDATLTLYVLLPLPVLAISIYFVSDTINKKSTAAQEQLSAITTQAQEAFSGIRVLKAYGKEEAAVREFDEKSMEYRNRTLKLVKTESLFQPFMILLIGLSTIFTIYIGGLQVIAGKISFGNIAAFVVFINQLTWPIASLGWVTSLIQRAAASQTRINEFLHTEPEIKNSNKEVYPLKGDIEFRNVSFRYPGSATNAITNISFQLNKGESLAIVGKTGSGKSTIANLICRMYDASEGAVLVDNKKIQEHNLEVVRQHIGYVPQDVFLFSDSIAHNIAFGMEQASESDIQDAAKQAAIHANISAFTEKYETIIGERGITLSGGQKQRISIARALLKKPEILLLDDCLSAVDTATEEEILQHLQHVMSEKTSIIISHRVSSVKNCKHILVLENGLVVEQGNHQQLLEKQGYYFNLHQMQLLENEKN